MIGFLGLGMQFDFQSSVATLQFVTPRRRQKQKNVSFILEEPQP